MHSEEKLKGREFSIPVYQGPLNQRPTTTMVYGFAKWNAAEYHPFLRALLRDPAYELYMHYDGIDTRNGCYRFALNRPHMGHEYYRGCSGAPVAGADGVIVSLVGGAPEESTENIIWGVPLADHIHLIGSESTGKNGREPGTVTTRSHPPP